nr:hypothetical protein [Desulfobulbaceae bacterium]
MSTLIGKHWHHLPDKEVIELLGGNLEKGLDHFEIKNRQDSYGPNALTAKKGKGPLKRFLLQFHQPLIYILIVSGIITALLQEWVDSGVIFGVVLVNAIIGYLQEAKAVNSLAALARTMTTLTRSWPFPALPFRWLSVCWQEDILHGRRQKLILLRLLE